MELLNNLSTFHKAETLIGEYGCFGCEDVNFVMTMYVGLQPTIDIILFSYNK